MEYYEKLHEKYRVALLAEGVDRNRLFGIHRAELTRSPSSRRAWIEITTRISREAFTSVALLAEGVDRNLVNGVQRKKLACRPPRGGRG